MFGSLLLAVFAAWCFGTAIRVHLRASGSSRPKGAGTASHKPDPEGATAPAQLEPQRVTHPPQAIARGQLSRAIPTHADDSEEPTTDLPREPTEEIQPELCVNIWRGEIGGGETLAAVVSWDGRRARWSSHGLSQEALVELQRLVIARTGLWPGHGRAYVEGVHLTLTASRQGSRYRAEHRLRRTA